MLGKLVQEQKLLALERNGACWISGAIDEEGGAGSKEVMFGRTPGGGLLLVHF